MKTPRGTCSDCRDLIGGYVLDALDPAEATTVRRHLADCPECAAEHARLAGIPDLLDLAGATENAYEHPPAALEEAVLDRFAREHRAGGARRRPARRRLRGLARPFRRPLPAALTAAVATTAIAVAIALGNAGPEQYAAPGNTYQASLSGSPAVPSAHAYARLQSVTSGTLVRLKVNGLKGRPDYLYELWCVRDDGMKISAGTFRVDSHGRADVNLTTAAVVGDYHRLSVERRAQPPASAPGQPVMAGEIRF